MISLIAMFFVGAGGGWGRSLLGALLLTGVVVLGIGCTLLVSWLLSKTLLRGVPSSFTLEMPPFRPPQVGQVLLRSILDRTLFVLGRSAAVAAPAGLVIWCLANISLGDATLLAHLSGLLDPVGRFMGLDGVILLAFILGLPANEIVMPIIIMAYLQAGSIVEMESLGALRQLFVANGWTVTTALCTLLFSLLHWPCSTTLLTIRKEAGGWKWAALAALLPTALGACLCAAIAALAVSGLDTRRFTFEGFLPSGKKERRAALEELTGETRTMVFHEAPHRLRQTLADMVELLGDRPAALCRELTKLHEDTVRTTLAQAATFYRDNEPRGEYVLVVAGREKQNLPALTLEEGAARVLALRDGGMKLKEAVRRVADDTGLPRNALYDTALKA